MKPTKFLNTSLVKDSAVCVRAPVYVFVYLEDVRGSTDEFLPQRH